MDFRDLRNKVIHDAYEPTSIEAEDASSIVNSLIDYLRKITFKQV